MSDQGVKVSQLGFDASDTGDVNLQMSSGWPTLKIEATGVFNNLSPAVDTDIYEHNLGYPPFFLIFVYTDEKSYMQGPRQKTSEPRFYVTNTKLASESVSPTLPPYNIRWYVCRLPLDRPFQAPIYSLSADGAGKREADVGIKIPKEGRDPNSVDLRDFNFHSGTRSPQIHNVTAGILTPGDGGFYYLTWKNDLGYEPLYFGFQKDDNVFPEHADRWYGPINMSPGNTLTSIQAFSPFAGGTGSIIVFKDPFTPGSVRNIGY